jgi:low affinity Fe/Cu permease
MTAEPGKRSISDFFGSIAQTTSQKLGHPASFVLAVILIVVWAVSGPIFKYSDTWQLVINTSTTIVTFLMVFLIQNTQNRDMSALHLKLDELIRVNGDARDKLLTLEDMTEEELKQLKGTFSQLASRSVDSGELQEAKEDLVNAKQDIGAAEDKLSSIADRAPTSS